MNNLKTTPTPHELMETVETLKGVKIVTLFSLTSNGPLDIDVSADGQWGYDDGHALMFAAKLGAAINDGGAITIRQFREDTYVSNGTTLPYKNLYGAQLGDGKVTPVTGDALRQCYSYDAKTGKPIEPEEGVYFCEWPNEGAENE